MDDKTEFKRIRSLCVSGKALEDKDISILVDLIEKERVRLGDMPNSQQILNRKNGDIYDAVPFSTITGYLTMLAWSRGASYKIGKTIDWGEIKQATQKRVIACIGDLLSADDTKTDPGGYSKTQALFVVHSWLRSKELVPIIEKCKDDSRPSVRNTARKALSLSWTFGK